MKKKQLQHAAEEVTDLKKSLMDKDEVIRLLREKNRKMLADVQKLKVCVCVCVFFLSLSFFSGTRAPPSAPLLLFPFHLLSHVEYPSDGDEETACS